MKFRSALVVVAALGSMIPMSARAEHCDVPIYIFSTTRVQTEVDNPTDPGTPIGRNLPSVTSSAVGCTVVRDQVLAGEDPTTHPATETNLIYPNSNRLSVRLLENGRDPALLSSATLTWAGQTFPLVMKPGLDAVTQEPADYMDSQSIEIDPASTLVPNEGVATFCLVDDECLTAVYHTVAG